MATYGNAIYQYQDPTEVDISMLGKAVQFKQQNYDANTMSAQSLVNQYLQMDLARDIDKQYLGERLGALTEFVNSSGRKDWSRSKVLRDVNTYIGSAVDGNVAKAVASTKMYRKQMEEIEELRKKDPSLVHHANVYNATKDWNRYLESGKLGDSYRPQTYKNYVDIQKRIMENAPKMLEQFGTQIVYTPENGGNIYFQKIGKHEIVTKEEAEKFINMALGEDGMMQVFMNEDYQNQTVDTVDIAKRYQDSIDNKIYAKSVTLENMIANRGGASEKNKAVIDNNIKVLKNDIANLSNLKKTPTSRDSMLYTMGLEKFKSGWADFLSYDKLVDVETDNTNFQILQYQAERKQEAFQNQMSVLNYEAGREDALFNRQVKTKELELQEIKLLADGSVERDINGNLVQAGLNVVDKPSEVENQDEYDYQTVQANYSQDYNSVVQAVKADLADPKKREALEKEFGDLSGLSAEAIAWNFVGKGGLDTAQTKLARAKSMGLFSESTTQAMNKAMNSYIPWAKQGETVKNIGKNIQNLAPQLFERYKGKKEKYAFSDTYIDENGIIRGGEDAYSKLDKKYSDLSKYERIGYELNVVQALSRDAEGDNKKIGALANYREQLIAQLPKSQQGIAREVFKYHGVGEGFVNAIAGTFSAGFSGLKGIFHGLAGNKEEARKSFEEGHKTFAKAGAGQRDAFAYFQDLTSTVYDFDDWGDSVSGSVKDRNGNDVSVRKYLDDNIFNESVKGYESLQKYKVFEHSNKAFAVDTSVKANKDVLSLAGAMLPDEVIASDATITFDINTQMGTATMLVPVKDGSDIEMKNVEVPLSSIPNRLTSKIDFSAKSASYDANQIGSSYTWEPEILDTKKQVLSKYGNKYINPSENGILSKEEIIDLVTKQYGTKEVEAHRESLNKILDSDIKMKARAVQGTYVLDLNIGDKTIVQNLNKSNITSDIDLITEQSNKIVTETVLQMISDVIKRK